MVESKALAAMDFGSNENDAAFGGTAMPAYPDEELFSDDDF